MKILIADFSMYILKVEGVFTLVSQLEEEFNVLYTDIPIQSTDNKRKNFLYWAHWFPLLNVSQSKQEPIQGIREPLSLLVK